MSEKRMVIVSDRLMRKIDVYRGQLSRADFVDECVRGLLQEQELGTERGVSAREKEHLKAEVTPAPVEHVTRGEFEQFRRSIDKLQQEFMDFFIKYGKQLAGEALSKEEAEHFSSELRRLLQL